MGQTAVVVAVAAAIQTLGAVVATSLAVFGPVLLGELDISALELGFLVAAMNVGALPAILATPIVDRFGSRRALAGSALLSAAAVATFAADPGFPVMLVALVLAGTGWGLSAISGGGAIIEGAPFGRRALFISLRQVGLPLGGVIAGLMTALIDPLGWQAVFLLQAMVFALMAAVAFGSRWPETQRRASPWRRHPPVRASQLGILSIAMTIGQWAFLVYLTIELTQRLAVPFAIAAAIFLTTQVVGVVGRVALGALSDRLGMPRTPILAAVAAVSGALLLAFGLLGPETPLPLIAALAIGASFTVLGWNGLMVVIMAEAGPTRFVNMNLGAGLTLMRIGNIVAPPLFGTILALAGSTIAWAAISAFLIAAAAGLVIIGPGPSETGDGVPSEDLGPSPGMPGNALAAAPQAERAFA
jgi:MFS family permease